MYIETSVNFCKIAGIASLNTGQHILTGTVECISPEILTGKQASGYLYKIDVFSCSDPAKHILDFIT